ncbi:hypothetical protein CVT24_005620 [Panaeolus cyanescens]|uniref:Prolyl 4-hydroxylase alpha subunit Fe(2+) 2OG dioxygenase domain-containing protein n=1 Tax=Panaeolus cyanescens TaxID=181874 RepID=A0A409YY79_9AGAR|nr:hypothetical protein CVT24_005620 [Panaeolus cyanescens]
MSHSAAGHCDPAVQVSAESLATVDEASSDSSDEYDGDLNDDLDDALRGDFEFTGSYYHRSVEPNAPNPGLTIEGLGLVGLPLSERDATAIVSLSAQAPFGKGLHTVIDTTVRDTWEIEPAKISFANPAWLPFVDQIATQKVWASLGVAPFTTRPKCELYKLLLYQKGSHFRPHQDTAKANGMFATIIIVLPSAFEGGEVHVSHAGTTTVLDIAKDSAFSTSVLAWYTDVVHEVKPLTAGYRLALSYNLIHTSPNAPKPSLPNLQEGPLQLFKDTLQRWKDDKYPEDCIPDPALFAFMLAHQYSQLDIKRGLSALKGKDAFLVSHLLPIAQEMGFVFCLANLVKTVSGSADDCGYSYSKRRRSGYWGRYDEYDDDDDGETPDILEVEEESMEISNLIRITANEAVDLGVGKFDLSSEALVPRTAFDHLSPDDSEYEGYQGNYAGNVDQWYRRSALVIYNEVDEISIIMSISGAPSLLRTLPFTETPTAKARQIVNIVLLKGLDGITATTVLSHAVLWKDHVIWNKAVQCLTSLDAIQSAIIKGRDVFGLDTLQPGLSGRIKKCGTLKDRFSVTKVVATHFSDGMNTPWIKDIINDALVSYSSASVADVPNLVQLAQELEDGLTKLATTVIPKTAAQPNSYDFHVTLTEALEALKNQMENSEGNQDKADILSGLVRQSLMAAASQWSSQPPPPPPTAYSYMHANSTLSPTVLGERINRLIKMCFSTGNSDVCTEIGKFIGVDRQMDLLSASRAHVGNNTPPWVQEIMKSVVSTYSNPAISHIPTLTWMAKELGPQCIDSLVANKIPKSGIYEFLFALAKSLQECLSLLSRDQNTTEDTKVAFKMAISRCVQTFIPQWEAGVQIVTAYTGYGPYRTAIPAAGPNAKVKRILDIVEFCFTIGDLSPCTTLFRYLLQIQGNTNVANRFKEVHSPLVPLLKAILTKHNKDILLEPFKSFFKGTISLYLGRILGVVPPAAITVLPTRSVTCSCAECNRLKTFLGDSNQTLDIMAVQAVRTHVEKQIALARIGPIITLDTIRGRTPYTLRITKRNEVMAGFKWKEAQTEALKFVQVVGGNDENLRQLMQERYDDMIKSFSGTKTFVVGQLTVGGAAVVAPSTSAAPVPGPSGSSGVGGSAANTAVAPVAGGKRKQRPPPPTNIIDVIDLT